MSLIGEVSRTAVVFDVSGIHEDGWCEPLVTFKVGVNSDVSLCQLAIWLMREPDRQHSHFSVRFGSSKSFEFDLLHERTSCVQIACPSISGGVIEAALHCDNLVSDKGQDLRPLSFKINSVAFA